MPLLKFDFDSKALEQSTEPFVKALTNDREVFGKIAERLDEIVLENFDSLQMLDPDTIDRRKYFMSGWRTREETSSQLPLVWSGELKNTRKKTWGNHFAKITRGKDAYWTIFHHFGTASHYVKLPERRVFDFTEGDSRELAGMYEDFLTRALEGNKE